MDFLPAEPPGKVPEEGGVVVEAYRLDKCTQRRAWQFLLFAKIYENTRKKKEENEALVFPTAYHIILELSEHFSSVVNGES